MSFRCFACPALLFDVFSSFSVVQSSNSDSFYWNGSTQTSAFIELLKSFLSFVWYTISNCLTVDMDEAEEAFDVELNRFIERIES